MQKAVVVLCFFLAACGTSFEMSPDAAPDTGSVDSNCTLPSGIYYVAGELQESNCNIPDHLPDPQIKSLWTINDELPCWSEVNKLYLTDILNYMTGEECDMIVTDKILTTDSAFLMYRQVTTKCAPGTCYFTILFTAWRNI